MNPLTKAILLSALPISEIRGGIPLAFYYNIKWAIWILILVNILIIPIIFLFLDYINHFLMKLRPYKIFFNRMIKNTRKKTEKKIEKYGYLGLTLFVAIPLPVTGAYTGALAAWLFGMNRKKSFLSIALGVIIASIIVMTIVSFGITTFNIFIKNI